MVVSRNLCLVEADAVDQRRVTSIITEDTAPEIKPKVRTVFFMDIAGS